MLCKNLTRREKIWKLPLRFLLDAISAWKGLLTGDIDFFKAIFSAHIAVIWRILTDYQRSKPEAKPLKKLEGVYHGSVVWQYFINHKTRFREILGKKD